MAEYGGVTLTHYTDQADKLQSILSIGFVYFPNEKGVFRDIIGMDIDEPQCRGMVSFCDLPIDISSRHRRNYGNYGIGMKKRWAFSQGASKVLYVGKGTPVFDAFSVLFQSLVPKVNPSGNEHLDKWLGELGATRSEFSKSFGNPNYPYLLDLHEFMQSDEQVAESEWRIISKLKGSWSKGMSISELKQDLLKIAKAGILPTLTIQPDDVEYIVCPEFEKDNFHSILPEAWRKIQIIGVEP